MDPLTIALLIAGGTTMAASTARGFYDTYQQGKLGEKNLDFQKTKYAGEADSKEKLYEMMLAFQKMQMQNKYEKEPEIRQREMILGAMLNKGMQPSQLPQMMMMASQMEAQRSNNRIPSILPPNANSLIRLSR
jgi:hypothetical protein